MTIGSFMIWYLAAFLVFFTFAGLPIGVAGFRDNTQCLGNRVAALVMGVALSFSAGAVVIAMAPAFVAVVL